MTGILVTGKNGQVGWELSTALAPLGPVVALDRSEMDLASPDSIRRAIRNTSPEVIVNAAAYTAVDKAESESDVAMQVNGIAPGIMAEEGKRLGAILIHYSTDYVFDGELGRPYAENDAPNPLNTYGRSKLAGERAIEAVGGRFLVLRTSGVYSDRRTNFVLAILRRARDGSELSVVNDQFGSPTWARALAEATRALLHTERLLGHGGVYHLAAAGRASRYELAKEIIGVMRTSSGRSADWATVRPVTTDEYERAPARRPRHPLLSQEKIRQAFGLEMPDWKEQLRLFLQAHAPMHAGR